MTRIAELFQNPIDRPIEEVIKVDQDNPLAVATEIDEYVATNAIRDQYRMVLKEIAEAPSNPREGIGIWVSGFFGSGKSSFAKILGYTLANKKVGDKTAPALFKKSVADPQIAALIDSINARIPFDAVIFDVSMERGVRSAADRLTEIMYRQLLRQLDYAEDFDLAELEITLEEDKKLKQFEAEFQKKHGEPWHKRRQMGLAINEASDVLHVIYPNNSSYAAPDSYAVSVGTGRADVDPNKLARRAFELAARRAPGKALVFIVDEVGQYVARSVDKMLDLMGIVQALGKEGRNRTERREVVSPFWLVVTSQEKLNEVVTALDSKKIELARLMDRFRLTVDLKQTDIVEVTAKRVLAKTPAASKALEKIFDKNSGRIRSCCSLERSARNLEIDRTAFTRLYPYLPYQIDLCIDIVSGLRLRRGAHRHVGGSNRTIIKQAQEMMINDRTRLADAPVGRLVTLDLVYELLEVGNLLPSEVTREIGDVATRLKGDEMALKLVKAIALLESVKDLPRTPHNLAVVLHPAVDAQPLTHPVEKTLEELERTQFVRNTEEGFKLLTVQEKQWETNRNGREPREADRHRLHRESISDLFSEPKLRSMVYHNLRAFKLRVALDGQQVVSDGDIPLQMSLVSPSEWNTALAEARSESAAKHGELFWIASLNETLRDLVTELYRSREMVGEFDRMGAQQRLTAEESSCLADEKKRRDKFQRDLRDKMSRALESGTSFFRGVERTGASLGSTLSEMTQGLLEIAIPDLFPKLGIGNLPLAGGETEKFLTATNLSGLPKVFYDERPERSLVIKQGGQFVPNLGCDLSRELLEHLRREHAYGNKVTGKILEHHFGGPGYGWSMDSVRLGLAVLFRGGAAEVSHQGRKYRHYSEPPARQPFSSTPAFRAASFSPREALDLKILAAAARTYEELTGRDVNIEEGEIAQAFRQVAAADREKLLPLSARLQALGLPGAQAVQDQLTWVEGILESAPDECVKTLASEGKSFLEGRRLADQLGQSATDPNIETIRNARRILNEQWPVLMSRGAIGDLAKPHDELVELLDSDECLQRIEAVRQAADAIGNAYHSIYVTAFEERSKAYQAALEIIKGRPEWLEVSENPDLSKEQQEKVLAPLLERAEAELNLPAGATVCRRTGATLAQIESDILAVEAVAGQVLRHLMKITAPEEKIERVSVARLYPARIASNEELDEFLGTLRERLAKIIAAGGTIVLE
jgi:hypothetical protein